MNRSLTISDEANDLATPEQWQALSRLLRSWQFVAVARGGPDLPDGYLSFTERASLDGVTIYGGIAPDGDVST